MKDEKICLVNGCFKQIPEHFDENESTQDQRYEHSPMFKVSGIYIKIL